MCRIIYLCGSFSAKEPHNSCLFCGRDLQLELRMPLLLIWLRDMHFYCRVVIIRRMPYLYRLFCAREPYDSYLFFEKTPATWSILCIFATLYATIAHLIERYTFLIQGGEAIEGCIAHLTLHTRGRSNLRTKLRTQNSNECPGKLDNLEIQIFEVWSPLWADCSTVAKL